MAGAMYLSIVGAGGVVSMPAQRGRFDVRNGVALEQAPLPTDPVGSLALSLRNVVVGSTYDVEVWSTGQQIASGAVATSTVVLSIPVYAPGDAKNTLRVKLRKSSGSPFYQPYETQVAAQSGAQSIFVNQLSDE